MKYKQLIKMILCVLLMQSGLTIAGDKKIIGWVEPVSIDNGALTLQAKIDTGADGLSINARNVTEFEKDGISWVSFKIVNGGGKEHTITKPVISHVRVKRKSAESQRRPVIILNICLDRHQSDMKVNLVDRGNYKYQGLIGRRFLEGHFLVDSENMNTTKPKCKF